MRCDLVSKISDWILEIRVIRYNTETPYLITILSFQEAKLGLIPPGMSAMVDLRQAAGFSETFFIVVAEGVDGVCLMHMWELTLASSGDEEEAEEAKSNQTSRSATPEADEKGQMKAADVGGGGSRVTVTTRKVCSQPLPLPANVEVNVMSFQPRFISKLLPCLYF